MDGTLGPDRICELQDKYPVEVDYDMELEELMNAGGYNDIHPDIQPSISWITESGKKDSVNLHLFPIGQPADTDGVRAMLKSKGLRPANLFEILVFGAKYQEVQWQCQVVALGSRWRNKNGDERVAYLGYNPFGRAVMMATLGIGKKWQSFCRFAAVAMKH